MSFPATAHPRGPARPLHRGGVGHGPGRVLLVEDEPDQAAILEAVLRHEGLDVTVSSTAEDALDRHRKSPVDVLVTDLNLPGMSGVELMRRLGSPAPEGGGEHTPSPPAVIVVTGAASVSTAVEALKLGATDYLQKPLDPARLVSLVRELLSSDNVREADVEDLSGEGGPLVFEGMIGGSRRMREVFARIDRVASTMAPVLVVGESGTGKELVARAIHARSPRKNGPFVPVHTGAIPRELIGSELFGHEKGSFTGAFSSAEGKFEAATGGTVFLDEVGTMDAAVQVSLLRVLETYRFTRVGGRKELEADVRVVAATNKDLLDLVDANVFREDLYYRLNVFTITLPPLREREEDILPIAERFLVKYAKRYGTPPRRLSDSACERLLAHDWPGNVRELRNVIEQTAVFATSEVVTADELQIGQGRIERRAPRRREEPSVEAAPARHAGPASQRTFEPFVAEAVPSSGRIVSLDDHRRELPHPEPPVPPSVPGHEGPSPPSGSFAPPPMSAPPMPPPPSAQGHAAEVPGQAARNKEEQDHPLVLRLPVGTRLADAERKLILLTLEAVRGNKQRAARVLGISRRGLYSKLQAYGEHVAGASADAPTYDAGADADQAEAPEAGDATESADEQTVDEGPLGTLDAGDDSSPPPDAPPGGEDHR